VEPSSVVVCLNFVCVCAHQATRRRQHASSMTVQIWVPAPRYPTTILEISQENSFSSSSSNRDECACERLGHIGNGSTCRSRRSTEIPCGTFDPRLRLCLACGHVQDRASSHAHPQRSHIHSSFINTQLPMALNSDNATRFCCLHPP
jgi:hypothetical protein